MRPGLAGLVAPLAGLLLLLLLGGCAIRPPTLGEPVLGPARLAVEQEFAAAMAQRRQRLRCLDAEMEVSWRSLLRSGMLPGYLRLMRPSRLIFFGTDPLGRPVLALMVDGDRFRLVAVADTKAYEGPVGAEAFRRYLPGGVTPEVLTDSLFDWFSGGLPFAPEIVAVYREREPGEDGGYWLELAEPRYARLLYLPATADSPGLVRRIQLFERRGGAPTEIVFDQYRPVSTEDSSGILPVPHRIELLTRRHQGVDLTIRLSEILADCPPAAEFQLAIPRGFLLEQVR